MMTRIEPSAEACNDGIPANGRRIMTHGSLGGCGLAVGRPAFAPHTEKPIAKAQLVVRIPKGRLPSKRRKTLLELKQQHFGVLGLYRNQALCQFPSELKRVHNQKALLVKGDGLFKIDGNPLYLPSL